MGSVSLPGWVRTRSRQVGPKPAVVCLSPGGDVAWSWADLWGRVRAGALALLDSGLEEDEPVVIWGEASLDTLVAELSVQAVGCRVLRFGPDAPPEAVAGLARRAGAFRVLAAGACRDLLDRLGPLNPSLRPAPVEPAGMPGGPGQDAFSEEPRLDARMSRIGPDVLALSVLRGPDWDPARARFLTHRNVLGIGRGVAARLQAGEEDTWWVPPPWDGPEAWSAGLGGCWVSGGILLLGPASGDLLQDLWLCHASVVVASREAGRRLAERAAGEVRGTRGPRGLLARACLRDASGGGRWGLGDLLRRAADGLGLPVLREVVGGRLRHVVMRDGGDDGAAAVLGALGVGAWGLCGPAVSGGALALDPLPRPGPDLHLLEGARVQPDAEGTLEVGGVSGVPSLRVAGMPGKPPPAVTPDSWYRSDWRGQVAGDRLRTEGLPPL